MDSLSVLNYTSIPSSGVGICNILSINIYLFNITCHNILKLLLLLILLDTQTENKNYHR